jgi:hypothetical protein
VPYYVTTILNDNDDARRILTSGRASLPTYSPFGTLHTYLLPLYGRRPNARPDGVIRGAAADALPGALECLNRFNAGLQFAPSYKLGDFDATSPVLHGLFAGDLYLYYRGREISGTMAVWNQNPFKQSVVAGYSTWMAAIRPFLALGARFALAPRLPRTGQPLPCLYAALISSRDSDEDVFRELLDAVLADWSRAGYTYLLLGLCDRHPFCPMVEKLSVMIVKSGIYLVSWRDCEPTRLPSADRVPHLEIATL